MANDGQVFAVTTKNPEGVLDYAIDWSDFLVSGETINTSTWTVPSGITKDSDAIIQSNTQAQIVLSGGTLNATYDLTNKITTTGGSVTRTDTRVLRVVVAFKSDIDRVRLLVGDQDTTDELLADDEYVFAMSETSDNKYAAAAICCRAIAGKFARFVNVSHEGIRTDYSQRQKHYLDLATRYDREAKLRGGGIGTPVAGGISIDAMDDAADDDDRPQPAFRRRMFRNPPRDADADDFDHDS